MTAGPPLTPSGPKSPPPKTPTHRSVSRSFSLSGPAGGSSSSGSTPSSPTPSRPVGPRSPSHRSTLPVSPTSARSRDAAGSSRTRYQTLPLSTAMETAPAVDEPLLDGDALIEDPVAIASTMPSLIPDSAAIQKSRRSEWTDSLDVEMEDSVHPPWRPPEAVLEPPEEHPPGYGVIEAQPGSDDEMVEHLVSSPTHDGAGDWDYDREKVDDWASGVGTGQDYSDVPMEKPELPQIGAGDLPRRWLAKVHEHELVQPWILDLPTPLAKKPLPPPPRPASADGVDATTSAPPEASLPTPERICTLDDVWEALPGGKECQSQWYFCTARWAWIRITAGRGPPPSVPSTKQYVKIISALSAEGKAYTQVDTPEVLQVMRDKHIASQNRLADCHTSQTLSTTLEHHLHAFTHLYHPTTEKRIDKVQLPPEMNAFTHITFGMAEEDPTLEKWNSPNHEITLYVSCSSDLWILVDEGLIAGQLPVGLVNAFTAEKMSNPGPGLTGEQSVNEAWTLLITLLGNALFKGQRGWVNLNNPRFQSKIGASFTASRMLAQIGFACREEPDGLRVGPISAGPGVSAEDVVQMDRYMLRTWVEAHLYLLAFQKRCNVPAGQQGNVKAVRLEEHPTITEALLKYPKGTSTYPDSLRSALHDLGVTKFDEPTTIETAYELQCACDSANSPKWLGALEKIAEAPIKGKESLVVKVVTERSLGKYTNQDVANAYVRIGYTREHADVLAVEAEEAPEDYILNLHKQAMAVASNSEKQELSRALVLIGQSRNSELMQTLGGNGQTTLSVEDAYAALSAPKDSIDDGLIMQYEMAVAEYPGKIDHYRQCLRIIAEAPGEERQGLITYLDTGHRDPGAPARTDIPVGLQNIGNTCYLNSILQYLYSIKPVREAVMSFEQAGDAPKAPLKPEVERSKRFVRQLRLLFLQLYKSEQSSVRPEEELAYLAITRPEIDQIVEPEITAKPRITLDTIPDIPSPSSTRVNSASPSPPSTPGAIDITLTPTASTHPKSVLGKRASEDRETGESNPSVHDRSRQKSEGFEAVQESDTSGSGENDFEMVVKPDEEVIPPSTSPISADIGTLDIKSPDDYFAPQREVEDFALDPSPVFDAPKGPPPLPPRPNIRARRESTLQSGLRFGLQQDSAEVLINVLSQLESAFDPPSSDSDAPKPPNLIQSLFSCKFQQQIVYQTANGSFDAQQPVDQVFSHPIIGVEEEGKDLYDCLGELYLHGSEIEYEGKKGYIMDLMGEFPPMLYIQMRRSQYDPATGRERKTNTHIPFGQTLNMDRYLASADPEKREKSIEITRELMRVRARLHALRNHKPMSIPDTFKHVRESLEHIQDMPELEITPDFLAALTNEGNAVAEEITQLEAQMPTLKEQLDAIWKDEQTYEYELVSVFMHRGKSSGAGHYWTYQSYLPDHPATFFKYNDETVTEVDDKEVLQDRTGSDANPALLCYVRRGRGLVDTLHREICEASAPLAEVEEAPIHVKEGILID